jgi:hypothetical protein
VSSGATIRRLVIGPAAVAVAMFGVSPAVAGIAETTVTIKNPNNSGDFFGYVKSNKPKRCADGRKVTVFKQHGTAQEPRSDEKIGRDTAELSGGKARWELGNTGEKGGKFYARASRRPGCHAALSETIG